MKFYVRIKSTNGNIRDCLLFNSAFIISDVTQSIVVQFVQSLLKNNNISGFAVVFFLGKLPKFRSLKLNMSRMAEGILNDFAIFGIIL